LQNIAKENASYRLELEDLVNREQLIISESQATRPELDEIKNDFTRTRQRVDVVGASEAIGRMLKARRDALPSVKSYRRTSAERSKEISRATDRQIDIDELLRELGDINKAVTQALRGMPEEEQNRYRPDASELFMAKRDALNELQKVYGRYTGQITSLDLAKRQLVEVASAYISYIDDQLIWIPGPGVATLLDPVGFGHALAWLLSPAHGLDVAKDVWQLVLQQPLLVALMLGLFIFLLKKRGGASAEIGKIARETRKLRSDSFKLTLFAIVQTLIIISPWPLLLIGSGWLLGSQPTAMPYTIAIANGLVKAGIYLTSIRFIIQICLDNGLGDRHLRWLQPVRSSLVHALRWIQPFAVPLGFMIAAASGSELPRAVQYLGQIAFILLMLISTIFIFRLLRHGGTITETLKVSNADDILVQLHFLWFPLVMLLPLFFAITSAMGYHYASLHLELRAELTFWFFFGLFLFKELLLRSLYIAERRLRFEDALRRREELRAQRAKCDEVQDDQAPPISLDVPEVNFAELNEQNRRLVQTGFLFAVVIGIWGIWSDLLPALSFLNNTELPLNSSIIVDGITKEVPVTLGDLIVGFMIILVTVLAAKNIPGVLEIVLLQRLPLDFGARYAITSLSRYLIAGIGIFAAFSTLGLQWSSIQWLVAALSVGLGFGLQEIVANFISGIILLFERPIRVGDVITVDATTGKVTRIRIRATTITNWDKQELLIPNKEFITGRVINWTLSDKINRIVVMVGVAYGTDVTRAMNLMLEVAHENLEVLDDPPPVASFEAFGDNALTLQLRSYLGSMDNRLATITALHTAINEKFNAAGIVIAFPQRDLHLDTDRPLDIRLHRSPPAGHGEVETEPR